MVEFCVGIGVGVAGTIGGIIALEYLKGKTSSIKLYCVRYDDIYAYFKSEKVREILSENKNLCLIAKKENISSKLIKISLYFLDIEKRKVENSFSGVSFISENIDERLEKKFGGSMTWTVE